MSTAPDVQPQQRVVIIDDTPDLRELMRLAMTRGGFDVVAEAGDGQEGIDVVRVERPDVILLDLAMPVMDGLEALPTLRRLCPAATIIVLSGFGATQMSARAVAAGADGYVQKGSSLVALLDYVRTMAAGESRSARPLSIATSRDDAAAGTLSEEGAAPPAGERPAATPPRHPDRVESSPASMASRVSAWEAPGMAPYGILELADEPLFRIVYANAVAQRLLGATSMAGTPLGLASPALASLVSYHRLDADASFEVELEGGTVRATLRRTGWSVLVYLDSTVEDVGLLRRAMANTAFEIRGPVAVLNGVAETIAWSAEDLDEQQRAELMGSVARQARLLDSITADLLTVAQIQRGTLRTDMQAVDPASLIRGVLADRHSAELLVEDDRSVRADPLRLEQMLDNLLENAREHGGAPYTLRVRPQGHMVCIDVIDEGEGVPPEFRDRLFTEYARANDTVANGSGLGLYVVRTLAQAQGGNVDYAPRPGGGSIFTIALNAC
jgi:signal transduction histidine kinase/DNA-binding NarL/FixJ family response regulator